MPSRNAREVVPAELNVQTSHTSPLPPIALTFSFSGGIQIPHAVSTWLWTDLPMLLKEKSSAMPWLGRKPSDG